MDVCCERCQAEYELEDTQVGPQGATVRCSNCDATFRVNQPTLAADLHVAAPSGEVLEFPTLRALRDAARRGDVTAEHVLIEAAGQRPLGVVDELRGWLGGAPIPLLRPVSMPVASMDASEWQDVRPSDLFEPPLSLANPKGYREPSSGPEIAVVARVVGPPPAPAKPDLEDVQATSLVPFVHHLDANDEQNLGAPAEEPIAAAAQPHPAGPPTSAAPPASAPGNAEPTTPGTRTVAEASAADKSSISSAILAPNPPRRLGGYWAAAAVVLLGLGAALRMTNRTPAVNANTDGPAATSPSVPPSASPPPLVVASAASAAPSSHISAAIGAPDALSRPALGHTVGGSSGVSADPAPATKNDKEAADLTAQGDRAKTHGRTAEARELYRRALVASPGYLPALSALSDLGRGPEQSAPATVVKDATKPMITAATPTVTAVPQPTVTAVKTAAPKFEMP